MVLTVLGYLLLVLSGLAVCLFCCLSYCSLTAAARPPEPPARDSLLEQPAGDTTPPVGAVIR